MNNRRGFNARTGKEGELENGKMWRQNLKKRWKSQKWRKVDDKEEELRKVKKRVILKKKRKREGSVRK